MSMAMPARMSGLVSMLPRSLVGPMAKAAIVVGAHGVMVEVHPDPDRALCDGAQSLTPEGFGKLVAELKRLQVLLESV